MDEKAAWAAADKDGLVFDRKIRKCVVRQPGR